MPEERLHYRVGAISTGFQGFLYTKVTGILNANLRYFLIVNIFKYTFIYIFITNIIFYNTGISMITLPTSVVEILIQLTCTTRNSASRSVKLWFLMGSTFSTTWDRKRFLWTCSLIFKIKKKRLYKTRYSFNIWYSNELTLHASLEEKDESMDMLKKSRLERNACTFYFRRTEILRCLV